MTDNVIKFPFKTDVETITIEDEGSTYLDAYEFFSNIIDLIHDGLHENTGDCIFTDEEFHPLVNMLGENLIAMYLLSQGIDHPLQDVAKDFFETVDISENVDYNDTKDDIDKDEITE